MPRKRADTCHSGKACATPSLDDWTLRPEKPVMAGEKPSSDARRQRLAKALKANIAKRKAQARALDQARAEAAGPPAPPGDKDGCPN